MASPNEKLAASLKVLKQLQKKNSGVIKTHEITRSHRERLLKAGFIREITKGWFIISNPDEKKGDSTVWYTSYWKFCIRFLNNKYRKDWYISPEQSLSIHSGNFNIPKQLIIRSPKANNSKTELPNNTSIFALKTKLPQKDEIVLKDGVRLLTLPIALIKCSENYFLQHPIDARTSLAMIKDASDILNPLLKNGHSGIAGRLAGAFRNIGKERIAEDILKSMKAADYDVREIDPFKDKVSYEFPKNEISPQVIRINQMWSEMRDVVLNCFPKANRLPKDIDKYIKDVDDVFLTDAYNSLSIEGYQVTAELIEKVANGTWDPDNNEKDKEYKNAMAAKGYWEAFQAVKLSTQKILKGENPGNVAEDDHGEWYRNLFSPSVTAGLLNATDLAGYRNAPVFIRNSYYVPMNYQAVRDVMPAFFELLKNENEPAVRAVLGHFIFVFIHPYMDGNGRIGRFIMNIMLASGGFPWTVIPVEERDTYSSALEKASVDKDIKPFAEYICRLVNAEISGNPIAKKV